MPGLRLGRAATDEADLDHRRLDDGADVHAVLLGKTRMGEAQAAVAGRFQPGSSARRTFSA